MSHPQLQHSMFYQVFFPEEESIAAQNQAFTLERLIRFTPPLTTHIESASLVVFDFETTGLDTNRDRIIEIGALKIRHGQIIEEFSTLIEPDIPMTQTAANVTGITPEMLVGQPRIESVLPDLLRFMEGSLLVAHNAEFDMAFLRHACRRVGIKLEWPCFCTLKLTRQLLPQLESRNLDALAAHYGLTFEARHRSIGDCKVTSAVLHSVLAREGQELHTWQDLQPFAVNQ